MALRQRCLKTFWESQTEFPGSCLHGAESELAAAAPSKPHSSVNSCPNPIAGQAVTDKINSCWEGDGTDWWGHTAAGAWAWMKRCRKEGVVDSRISNLPALCLQPPPQAGSQLHLELTERREDKRSVSGGLFLLYSLYFEDDSRT